MESCARVVGHKVRLNLKPKGEQTAGSEVFGLQKGVWTFPTDEAVDLAAMPFSIDTKLFDVQWTPTDLLVDPKADGVAEGDPLLFAGLFVQYMGLTRMQPIVRSGSLAMIPEDLLSTTLKKPGRIYFAELHAFGGNSGSPVFVDVGGMRKGRLGYEYKLLGVVSGEVFETADFHLQVLTTYTGGVSANSGISIVVPASELKNFIEKSPELQKIRDATVEQASSAVK